MLSGLSGETRLYPIIGDPIHHVKSPQLLTIGLSARGHDVICVPMEVSAGSLAPVMVGLSAIPNVDGLLITLPHRFTAFGYCATTDARASQPRGVSVMRRNRDGSWHGAMLDGLVFVKA